VNAVCWSGKQKHNIAEHGTTQTLELYLPSNFPPNQGILPGKIQAAAA
jgi:hypothetical protein